MATVTGANWQDFVQCSEGLEMKAVFVTVVLSILSAALAVFSITELCSKNRTTGDAGGAERAATTDARPAYAKPRLQQWLNH